VVGGKEFYATGRIRFVQSDAEGTYYWEEWVLAHPDGDLRFLEFDEGKYTLSEPFEPPQGAPDRELAIAAEGARYTIGGQPFVVTDAGTCRVLNIEGEIPFPVRIEQPVRFVDLEGPNGVFLSAEADDEGGWEWFRGRRLSEREVLTLFDLRDHLKALDAREQALGGRRFLGTILLVAALIAFVGWGAALGAGKTVASGSATLSQVPEDGLRLGPYRLADVNRVHRLRVSSNLSQSAAAVQAVLDDPGAGELLGVDGDFWDESGHDDEGAWHENNLQAHTDFRLSTPKNVYVRLYADPEATATNASASFTIEVRPLYSSYLGVFGFLALTLGTVFLIAGSPTGTQKMWQSMNESRD
jgi:hypothetical protein